MVVAEAAAGAGAPMKTIKPWRRYADRNIAFLAERWYSRPRSIEI